MPRGTAPRPLTLTLSPSGGEGIIGREAAWVSQTLGRRGAGGAALLSPYLSDERAAYQGSEAFVKVQLPYGETTIEAELPENTRRLSNLEQARLPPAP